MAKTEILAVCLLLIATTSAADPCYSNPSQCINDVRQLMMNTTRFWFGSLYPTLCPAGSMIASSSGCMNPAPDRPSLLSRVLNETDTTTLTMVSKNIDLANVTFNAPAGNYTGCGHEYHVPAVENLLIDPLGVTRVSSWSLTYKPTVTWPPQSATTYYTLIFWDPGNFYLHGFYINCVNGTSSGGEEIVPYFGPMNAHLRENIYIFAVHEQTDRIDPAKAKAFITGKSFIPMRELVARFSNIMGQFPSFVSLMTIVADAHSIQGISSKFFLVNNCPYLVSQFDTFHDMINATNIPVSWSNSEISTSLEKNATYLTSLTVALDVRFPTEDYSFQSCCRTYNLTRSQVIVDPFYNNTQRPGTVRNKPYVLMSPVFLQNPTSILGDMYTLFLVDIADGLTGSSDFTFVTHWLVTNIRNADIDTGDEVAKYWGPNPFTPNTSRPYVFTLLKQPSGRLNNSIFSDFCPNGTMRCRINFKNVLDAWGLKEIVGLTWFTAQQDPFARYRLYDVLKVRTKAEVCQGLEGYAEPCPAPSCPLNRTNSCPSTNNGNGQTRLVYAPPLMAVTVVFGIIKHIVNII